MNPLVISVSQLNKYVRSLLEGDRQLSSIYVVGEISNFKAHGASGHLYLSLKDAQGLIRSVMFQSDATKLRFLPQDGMRVICCGHVSLWERDGQYQFYIRDMQPDGAGALAIAFEQVKNKLEAEGLFAQELKKPLPRYPRKIALITSGTGAALQDMLRILGQRYPACGVVLCSVLVQGILAAQNMVDTLNRVYQLNDVDLIIIGRGGGSAEDLSAFNDEILARTIRQSPVPIISAVGHETDYTICDFVADLRAPTPTAAAQMAVPDSEELAYRVRKMRDNIFAYYHSILTKCDLRLQAAKSCVIFKDPKQMVSPFLSRKEAAKEKLLSAYNRLVAEKDVQFRLKASALHHLSPLQILSRGYAVATKNGAIISSKNDIKNQDDITLKLKDGEVTFTVGQVR